MSDKKDLPAYTLTIYLIKKAFKDFDSVIDEDNMSGFRKVDPDGMSANNELRRIYLKNHEIGPPDWARLLKVDANRTTASGLCLREVEGRVFAIAFGSSGRFLINEAAIERRFGLMVVLNSIEPDSLRSIDKIVLSESGLQSRTQSSQPSDSQAFGVDIQQDLVRNVSGKAKNKNLYGSTIVGKDSLTVTIRTDLDRLDAHLKEYLDAFNRIDYRKDFSFIDNIKPCDSVKSTELDTLLAAKLQDNDASLKYWLTVPDIIAWEDHSGFLYSNSNKDEDALDDVSFETFRSSMKPSDVIDVDYLKKKKVHRIDSEGKRARDTWPVYKCLYAEMKLKNGKDQSELYILSDGSWYRINQSFKDNVQANYEVISKKPTTVSLEDYITGEREDAYNERLAKKLGGYLFDKKNITVTGRSPFEFCDVATSDKKLIHVKRYSGSSALSHLFNQGYVSANLMLEPEIRKRINDKKIGEFSFGNPDDEITTKDYEIIYGIISNEDSVLDIPFFSKIMLVKTHKDLRNLGYDVSLVKIKHKLTGVK